MKGKILNSLCGMTAAIACMFGISACAEQSHAHNYVESAVAPTCVDEGYTLHKCECGDEYRDNYVDATGHVYVEYIYNNDATCISGGTETAKCEFCDEIDVRKSIEHPATGIHTFINYTYNNDATCISVGTETAKCEFCDVTDVRQSVSHPETAEHDYSEGFCRLCEAFDPDAPFTEGLAYTPIRQGIDIIGYSVSKGGATDNKYIKIPNEYNGKPVSRIGSDGFSGCGNLTTVVIPQSVTGIGLRAFDGCEKLVYNEYGDGKYLGNAADPFFAMTAVKNDALTSCAINENTKIIADGVFNGCGLLSSIEIPDGVTAIGDRTFYNCGSLADIVLPRELKSVGDYAFYKCGKLTGMDLPNSVTHIGVGAFSNCNHITGIELPNGISKIENEMFSYCGSLSAVKIPSTVEEIGTEAFAGCGALASISIPGGVTAIGKRAFYLCSKLMGMEIPSGVKVISDYTFYRCVNLTEINMPYGITSIGNYAFYGCSKLSDITIQNTVTGIGAYAFSYCGKLTSLTISRGVKSIGDRAFYQCSDLTINCEAAEKPSGWHKNWNYSARPVVWGYSG